MKKSFFARLSGLSLVVMAVVAGVAYGYAFQQLYHPHDGEATLRNFLHRRDLYYMVLGGFTLILMLDLLVAWTLYRFFETAHPVLPRMMAATRVLYALFLVVALVHWGRMNGSTNAVEVTHHIQRFLTIWSLGLIVFGVHLLLLGALILRAPVIPSWMGYLAAFAGLSYVAIHTLHALWPGFALYQAKVETVLGLPLALGELCLALWLLVKAPADIS